MSQHKPLRVLVVDDSKMIHAVVRRSLKNYDVEILTAGNGYEGCRTAAKEMPDVIFLDVNMPEFDGMQALRKLKEVECTRMIPIIMMTAVADSLSQEEAFDGGVVKYLPKPVNDEMISAVLETVIDLTLKNEQP